MLLKRFLKLNSEPTIKVYHGYGDEDGVLVLGHVFKRSPFPPKHYKKGFLRNTLALIKYFMTKPYPNVKVQLEYGGAVLETITDEHGMFRFEWKPQGAIQHGWYEVAVSATIDEETITGEGKVLVPAQTEYGFISDIDDTFLVSHSSNLPKRLYQLFTENPQTRKPFEDVVKHYQLLQEGCGDEHAPFFYVSSSEWNLYEYIKEFCRYHELPEGVFLLSELKQWYEFAKTGQGKHETKFTRIQRIMKAFPNRKYVLLGDDTQKDPEIYSHVVEQFIEQVACIYIRRVERKHYAKTKALLNELGQRGVEVFYYKHSTEAIAHSKKVGLIKV